VTEFFEFRKMWQNVTKCDRMWQNVTEKCDRKMWQNYLNLESRITLLISNKIRKVS